eukprot:TRINITY_DN7647_c2_g1_i1.p1 TRINITY_DN7647_c2_g1~~TRINITY_DN7647_c2_g1_i1.p1  ORF type:complete len:297 (-),score=-0.56 TRINITY_DN7647_c2_g1_i1:486-1286(-)
MAAFDDSRLSGLTKVQIECMSEIQWQSLSSYEVKILQQIPDLRIKLQRFVGLRILSQKGITTIRALYMHPIWSDQLEGFLNNLQDFPMLRDLRLECNVIMYGLRISKEQFRSLMEATQLTCLKMRSVNFLELSQADFLLMNRLSSLQKLSIRNNVVGFPQSLVQVINKMTWLQSLELEQGGFNAFTTLTHLCRLTALTSLSLKPVLLSGLQHTNSLQVLSKFTKLKKLYIGLTMDASNDMWGLSDDENVVETLRKKLVKLRRLTIK